MVGASNSIAQCNTVLNTAVAEALRQFADILEPAEDFETELNSLIRDTIKKHKRIIFNGNGYDDKWIREAVETRGLNNFATTPDALEHYLDEKNIKLFASHGVYTEPEMRSRHEIMLESYVKTLRIEANTMIDMIYKQILPAISAYTKDVSDTGIAKKALCAEINVDYEVETVKKLTSLTSAISKSVKELENQVAAATDMDGVESLARIYRDFIVTKMEEVRSYCDEAEFLTAAEHWPYPVYSELLFGII